MQNTSKNRKICSSKKPREILLFGKFQNSAHYKITRKLRNTRLGRVPKFQDNERITIVLFIRLYMCACSSIVVLCTFSFPVTFVYPLILVCLFFCCCFMCVFLPCDICLSVNIGVPVLLLLFYVRFPPL